eukprot:886709-Pleurochrysis_carterae.AAC.3
MPASAGVRKNKADAAQGAASFQWLLQHNTASHAELAHKPPGRIIPQLHAHSCILIGTDGVMLSVITRGCTLGRKLHAHQPRS